MSQSATPPINKTAVAGNITEDAITAKALEAYGKTPDPRLRELMTALVRHLHAFVREVSLTEKEWFHAIDFLTRTGHMCVGARQEFILLSDILGVSMVVDLVNHHKVTGATESTVLGPFFANDAPELPFGGNIAPHDPGTPLFFSGRVTAPDGTPLSGAVIDAWQTGSDGLYDVQHAHREEPHMRGRFRAGSDGRYLIRSVRPISYSIPVDGPVGEIMSNCKRQPLRPAHTHFMIAAPGYDTLITHLFDPEDPLIELDPVFAFKSSLIYDIKRHDQSEPGYAVDPPFYTVQRDFILSPAAR
jgi:hydroxyquinol 1,2-dioxygenase